MSFEIDNGTLVRFSGHDREVDVPSEVVEVADGAFKDCTDIESVKLPSGLERIGNAAFWGCAALSGLTIPPSLTAVGESIFYGCNKLVTISGGTQKSRFYAKGDCIIDRASSEVVAGCRKSAVPDGVLGIRTGAFSGIASHTGVALPDSVTSIAGGAFTNSGITMVVIPRDMAVIGENAFSGCDGILDVYYRGDRERWNAIIIGNGNNILSKARIHFNV